MKKSSRDIFGKTVLVTGGAGFIGSHLVDHLIASGVAQVVVMDNMFLGSEKNLEKARLTGKLALYVDDAELATSLDYIFQRHKIDAVFNCATKALNYSFINPAHAFGTNVTVTLNLLELQRRGAYKTLCHFSTSEVYGSAIYEPMDEQHPCKPTTTYAAGKAAADLAVESYVHMFGVDAFIVRPFNNYGPRQNYKGELAGVIPATAWRILTDCPPEIHGDGRQSRNFIYVRDTVDAVLKVFRVLPAGESVNISTGNRFSIGDLVLLIAKTLGYRGEINRTPSRAADVFCHNACNQKLRSLVDYADTDFVLGLTETLEWYAQSWGRGK
jgi:UDP-glucose 4-epimerase